PLSDSLPPQIIRSARSADRSQAGAAISRGRPRPVKSLRGVLRRRIVERTDGRRRSSSRVVRRGQRHIARAGRRTLDGVGAGRAVRVARAAAVGAPALARLLRRVRLGGPGDGSRGGWIVGGRRALRALPSGKKAGRLDPNRDAADHARILESAVRGLADNRNRPRPAGRAARGIESVFVQFAGAPSENAQLPGTAGELTEFRNKRHASSSGNVLLVAGARLPRANPRAKRSLCRQRDRKST